MEDNKLFHNRYFLERLLGRGNFSEVWLAKDTLTEIPVALKIYAPATGLDDQGLNVFAREFSLVVNANHKNLLKPLYYDSCDRKPYLVLPFCTNGSIMKNVGKFTEEEAWVLLRDVASGLAWLHSMNPPVIHQDIKPDNIMIGENGEYMITDFGVSTHLRSTLRKSLSSAFSSAGTIAYMAPERFGKDNTPIMANDVYSLGATVFEMLTGDTPFGDDGGLVQKKGADVPELKGEYSDQLKKTLSKCLKLNPWERPTAEQLATYADAAVRGEKIKFADEKTFIQKYKWIIVGFCAGLIISVIAGISFVNKQKQEKAEQIRLQLIDQRNDSILTKISSCENAIKNYITLGDVHDEGYETAYIDAYKEIDKALKSAQELPDGVYKNGDYLIQTKDSLISRLHVAYEGFVQKAEMFSDDPDVSAEFTTRAESIKNCIGSENIKKHAPTSDEQQEQGK